MNTTERLTKAFQESLSARKNPCDDWVKVGAGFLGEAIDHMDWLEKGNAEWRSEYQRVAKHAEAVRATARIAIGHLEKVLNGCRTAEEQMAADKAAREWLTSIGA